jgi:hypothetical protein
MGRNSMKFRQSDVTRAMRAVAAGGATVQRVEIEHDGKIVLVTSSTGNSNRDDMELDRWLANHADAH